MVAEGDTGTVLGLLLSGTETPERHDVNYRFEDGSHPGKLH